jgi:hypothetical protein
VEKHQGGKSFGISKHWWEDDIKMDIEEVAFGYWSCSCGSG